MLKHLALTLVLAAPLPAMAGEFGPAGILSRGNKEALPPITLSAGQPLATAPLRLKSGRTYVMEIRADGSQDLGLEGPAFLRAIWIDSLQIEDVTVRPLGLTSLAFGGEGTVTLTFVAVQPGRFDLHIPGARGDSQRVGITIE